MATGGGPCTTHRREPGPGQEALPGAPAPVPGPAPDPAAEPDYAAPIPPALAARTLNLG
ncbi:MULTISPECIES: hypothetical protein [Streptomyces]|uniref:hypothetical protein n=1 Tax=Streptomyces TaxID=1883 RepID=UPI00163CE8AB|nr:MULTISPECIES: hypothetical protein [Streptomyces]MBC2878648.1 hypothetical protein [Streptomyces sp. TYQ1024]UBI35299.1 hypothetical protein K7I03_01705 [Streptomyces mobaraensis]UKW27890.1 hypothetical protein MCU78_01740 [Streptomyces sp. TYQ1024]